MTRRFLHKRTLEEILSECSPVKMANGQLRMMCPFREQHTDGSGRMSFFVSPQINAYHCFSCNAKGRLVQLLTTRFGVNYFEAVELVQFEEHEKKAKEEFELDVIWDFNRAPEEFLRRGYTKETLKHFRVGMTDADEILIPYYSDFNHPTNLCGYQKRWYVDENRRVRNNKGFDKKEYLYNLDLSYAYVVVVEGQSDVWRLYQHGYNAVALMGADISSWQVEQLAKFDRVYLALDNDEAGRRGVEICNRLLRNVTNVLLVPYTTKDPGECADKSAWESAFAESTDYVVYSMEMAMNWDGYLEMRDKVIAEVERRKE